MLLFYFGGLYFSVFISIANFAKLKGSLNIRVLQYLLSDSLSCDLYLELFTSITSPSKSKTLVGRSMSYAHDFQFDLTRYIFYSSYYQDIKRQIRNIKISGLDGLVDSIRSLLINKNSDDFRYVDLLLRSF